MKQAIIRRFARRAAALGAAIVALCAATDALALSSAWERSDVTEVRLVSAQDALDAAGKASIGLQFRLAPGWKIYWRTPGEAGFPPQIDWSGSENLAASVVSWPTPTRFLEVGDLVTHGYKDEVVLPIEVAAADPGRAIELDAVVNYLASGGHHERIFSVLSRSAASGFNRSQGGDSLSQCRLGRRFE